MKRLMMRRGVTDGEAVEKMLKELAATTVVEERGEKLLAFIEARKIARQNMADQGEVNFWVCLVFQSHEQKLEFLREIVDVPILYGMYVDGQAFADFVGVPVTPNNLKPILSRVNKKLAGMALDEEEIDGEEIK